MDIKCIHKLIEDRGCSIAMPSQDVRDELMNLATTNKLLQFYFMNCLPDNYCEVSGCYLLGPLRLINENRNLAPSALIFEFGFTAIASTAGGNSIVIERNSDKVYFADHETFGENRIMYKDKATGEWVQTSVLNQTNVILGLKQLSDNFEKFIIELMEGKLEEQIRILS